ncbi:C6-zinc finger TF, regulator of conidiation [Madurella fahalii]|uniref:C6-zinc finger TF, regulator of conidiation n=1 Tax=Madurella fahalii TaxID=1157608 RepID=A0ABQ0G7G6_9PEZI
MPRQHLTPNACLVCRKKRTKCDGQLPCRRCRSRGEECSYEDKKWRTKDHLRSEIERLRAEQKQGHALLRALTNNDPARWEIVLRRLRAGEPPDAIAEWIHSSTGLSGPPCRSSSQAHPEPPYPGSLPQHVLSSFRTATALGGESAFHKRFQVSASGSVGGASHDPRAGVAFTPQSTGRSHSKPSFDSASRGSFSADGSPMRRLSIRDYRPPQSPLAFLLAPSGLPATLLDTQRRPQLPPLEVPGGPIFRIWTKVTSDARLVQRLLGGFFASSLHHLSLVSQPQFMRDFREGTSRYCSEALVNAILGTACRLLNPTSQLISKVSFGDAFIGEAKGLLAAEEDHVSLPSIQALGVLALAEMCQGNEDEAGDLARESVRACIRFVLQTQHRHHDDDDDFRVVRALVYCGGFSLIRALRLLTGDLEPKTGPLFMRLHPDPRDHGEDSPEARVERGISLQMQFFSELQHCPPLARFVFEITEAAHTFSSYNYSKAMTAGDLDGAFNRCISYHSRLFESAALDTDDGPDILFAKIWYHFCLLSLLQPFVTGSASLVDGLPPSLTGDATPESMCQQASEAIISLTSTYQARYLLTPLPPLLPYMVFAAVLYQLSLALDRLYPSQQDPGLVESPPVLSPTTACGSPSIAGISGSVYPRSERGATTFGPKPMSPVSGVVPQGSSQRRAAVFSAAPGGFSSGGLFRKPSVCSFTSSTTTDRDGTPPPEAGSDTLPTFTSRPADLVTIGSLQLTSMAAQHTGAAKATQLLRGLEDMCEPTESHHNQARPSSSLAEPLHPVPVAGDLDPTIQVTEIEFQAIHDRDTGSEVSSCTALSPVPMHQFGYRPPPAQLTGHPHPALDFSEVRQPPTLFAG